MFLPTDAEQQDKVRGIIASTAEGLGYSILGWRALPTDSTGVGRSALAVEPAMYQIFLVPGEKAMFVSLDLEQQVNFQLKIASPSIAWLLAIVMM